MSELPSRIRSVSYSSTTVVNLDVHAYMSNDQSINQPITQSTDMKRKQWLIDGMFGEDDVTRRGEGGKESGRYDACNRAICGKRMNESEPNRANSDGSSEILSNRGINGVFLNQSYHNTGGCRGSENIILSHFALFPPTLLKVRP